MFRILILATIIFFSASTTTFAEDHHHEKRDTHVTIVTPDEKHHHHCEEIRNFKSICLQTTRQWIRPTVTVGVLALGAYTNTIKNNNSSSQAAARIFLCYCAGFAVGDLLKKSCKLTMFLNDIPKN